MDATLVQFGQTHFGPAQLGDARRTRRLVRIADALAARPQGSLPDKMQSTAQLGALYHLVNQEAVTHAAVTAPHFERTRQAIRDHAHRVILIGHDDTELNLTAKRSLHEDLGSLGGRSGQRGYVCHNSLAITTAGEPLGLVNQILHTNPKRRRKTTRAQLRQCPRRQSRLWVRGREQIGDFAPNQRVIDLLDRGGDTFEFLDFEQRRTYRYVVRSKHNRTVRRGHASEPGEEFKLHDHLRGLPAMDRRVLDVTPKPALGRQPAQPGRTAEVEISWEAVMLPAPEPSRARGEHGQSALPVWVIRVGERAPPEGATGLEWFLLTNEPVTTLADAWERVEWYEWRWPVMEEYHKGMKTGCSIEGMQFKTTAALEPMLGLLSVVAWLLMHLKWSARNPETQAEPAVQSVPEQWVRILSRWRHGQERPTWTMREFLMALARLGGHQNRKGDGDPGWQTLWKGWRKLQIALEFADG